MKGTPPDASQPMALFNNAELLNNTTLQTVLERIEDPDVLPIIRAPLVFMYRNAQASSLLRAQFPWKSLVPMLNTSLVSCETRRLYYLSCLCFLSAK
jgi:hypothetical protein